MAGRWLMMEEEEEEAEVGVSDTVWQGVVAWGDGWIVYMDLILLY